MECEFKEVIRQTPGNGTWIHVQVGGDEGELLEYHVVPIEDADGHQAGLTCHCNPEIEYKDPETGIKYPAPLIVHNAFDGRHVVEQANKILNQ